jgi:hypothetical protein
MFKTGSQEQPVSTFIGSSNGVTTIKNSALMFFALYSNNKDYDEVYIQNYAKINLVPKLQRVKVGQVNVIGAKDYSMRIWIDPEKCPVITLHQRCSGCLKRTKCGGGSW